jgi:hypothetical protein
MDGKTKDFLQGKASERQQRAKTDPKKMRSAQKSERTLRGSQVSSSGPNEYVESSTLPVKRRTRRERPEGIGRMISGQE